MHGTRFSLHRKAILAALALSSVAATAMVSAQSCGSAAVHTSFPAGIDAREAERATWPGADDGNTPEELSLAMGEQDGVYWADGRAYLHAPIEDVAAALQDPEVTLSRRSVDEHTTQSGVEADYPISYRTHCVVHALITVTYDVTWRQGASERDGEMVGYVANYQKTDGTEFISHMKGSVLVERVSPTLTRLQFASELVAARTGPENVASYVEDLFASVQARVHGQPLPQWDD